MWTGKEEMSPWSTIHPFARIVNNENGNVSNLMQINQGVSGEVYSQSFCIKADPTECSSADPTKYPVVDQMQYPSADSPSSSVPINTTNLTAPTEPLDDLWFLLNSPPPMDQESKKSDEGVVTADDLLTIKSEDLYNIQDLLNVNLDYLGLPPDSSPANTNHWKTVYKTENSKSREETKDSTTVDDIELLSRQVKIKTEVLEESGEELETKPVDAGQSTSIYTTNDENLLQCLDLPIEEELTRLTQSSISDEQKASGCRMILTALWTINLAIDEKKVTPETLEIEEFPFKKKYEKFIQKNNQILQKTGNTFLDRMGCVSCPEIAKCVCPSCYCIRKCNDCFKKEKCGYMDKSGKTCHGEHRLVVSYLGHTPKQHQLTTALIRQDYPYTWIQYFAQNPASRETYENILGDLKQLFEVVLTEANKINKTSNTILMIFLAIKALVHHPKSLTNTWITNKVFCQISGCDNFATFVQYEGNTDQNRTFECKYCTYCATRMPTEYNSGVVFGEFRHQEIHRPQWKGRPYAVFMRMEERKKNKNGKRLKDVSEEKGEKKKRKIKA